MKQRGDDKTERLIVEIDGDLLQELLENARVIHPREVILILRGKIKRKRGMRRVSISDYLLPPQALHGTSSSSFNLHMLPLDFSMVGTLHSHPSGLLEPSVTDLNQMVGLFAVIVAPPYRGVGDVAVFDRMGRPQTIEVK
ncbi:MAG: Mov34/MPN/PAD-1 family protein [Candidatus Geothermarchaeales archaeon]